MNDRVRALARWLFLGLAIAAFLAAPLLGAEAQTRRDPSLLLDATRQQAQSGWSWLTTLSTFVVGGGALAAGGRALFKGDWAHGAVGIGLGVGVLLFMWALGNFFGY